ITAVVGWFSHLPKPVRSAVLGFGAFLAIGGPILIFLGKTVTAVGIVGKALGALKIETIATATAMKASLIGLAIFALIELVTHFKQVKKIALDVFGAIVRAAKVVGNALSHAFHGLTHLGGSILHTATFGLLHSGGPVRRHFDTGGPVGTDTIPGWLTPGEFVLNRATPA